MNRIEKTEKPILMTAFSVRAILAGRKTQTRRVMKPQPWYNPRLRDAPYQPGDQLWVRETWAVDFSLDKVSHLEEETFVYYRADEASWENVWGVDGGGCRGKWRPSIFMPRWASRLWLEVVNIRPEPLQDISEQDAIAEGLEDAGLGDRTFRGSDLVWHDAGYCYAALWDTINAKPKRAKTNPWGIKEGCYVSYPWDSSETRERNGLPWYVVGNPWVWVIEFKQV